MNGEGGSTGEEGARLTAGRPGIQQSKILDEENSSNPKTLLGSEWRPRALLPGHRTGHAGRSPRPKRLHHHQGQRGVATRRPPLSTCALGNRPPLVPPKPQGHCRRVMSIDPRGEVARQRR